MNTVILSYTGLHALAEMELKLTEIEGYPVELVVIAKNDSSNEPTFIKRAVSHCLDVNHDKLGDKTRVRHIVEARQIAMYLIKQRNHSISLKTIGTFFGSRDHSTVIHAINQVNDLVETDRYFKAKLNRCIRYLDAHESQQIN